MFLKEKDYESEGRRFESRRAGSVCSNRSNPSKYPENSPPAERSRAFQMAKDFRVGPGRDAVETTSGSESNLKSISASIALLLSKSGFVQPRTEYPPAVHRYTPRADSNKFRMIVVSTKKPRYSYFVAARGVYARLTMSINSRDRSGLTEVGMPSQWQRASNITASHALGTRILRRTGL